MQYVLSNKAIGPGKKSKINKCRAYIYSGLYSNIPSYKTDFWMMFYKMDYCACTTTVLQKSNLYLNIRIKVPILKQLSWCDGQCLRLVSQRSLVRILVGPIKFLFNRRHKKVSKCCYSSGVTILSICSSWGDNIDNIVTLHLETFCVFN